MYTQKDVWTSIADDTKFATCKQKGEEIKCIYGGVGSLSSFNSWVALTSTTLDDSSLMLAQFQKLNDARLTLENNNMKVSDLQFCFILIKVLPKSYPAVTSTILATGELKDLSPQKIQDQILNEEGCHCHVVWGPIDFVSCNVGTPPTTRGDQAPMLKRLVGRIGGTVSLNEGGLGKIGK